MPSLKECRKILGPTCTLSDSELDLLQESLKALAHIAIENYPKFKLPKQKTSPNQKKSVSFENILDLLSEAEREEAMERVSILEFEGRLPREEAEKTVILNHFKPNNRN